MSKCSRSLMIVPLFSALLVFQAFSAVPAHAGTATLDTGTVVDGTTGAVDGTVSDTTDAVGDTVSGATGAVDNTVSGATGTVDNIVSGATGAVNDATSGATGGSAPGGSTSGATGAVSGTISGSSSGTGSTSSGTTDTTSGGGSSGTSDLNAGTSNRRLSAHSGGGLVPDPGRTAVSGGVTALGRLGAPSPLQGVTLTGSSTALAGSSLGSAPDVPARIIEPIIGDRPTFGAASGLAILVLACLTVFGVFSVVLFAARALVFSNEVRSTAM
jgi:hypothetical protein